MSSCVTTQALHPNTSLPTLFCEDKNTLWTWALKLPNMQGLYSILDAIENYKRSLFKRLRIFRHSWLSITIQSISTSQVCLAFLRGKLSLKRWLLRLSPATISTHWGRSTLNSKAVEAIITNRHRADYFSALKCKDRVFLQFGHQFNSH